MRHQDNEKELEDKFIVNTLMPSELQVSTHLNKTKESYTY